MCRGMAPQSAIPILVPYAKHSLKPLQKRVSFSKGFMQRKSSLRSYEVTQMGMADCGAIPRCE